MDTLSLAIVQYIFTSGEHEVKIAPHGNSKGGESYDPLYAMMVMCKESEGKNAPEAFVQMVNAAPFPMVVLAFDWTLDDLVRFCTNADEF